MVYEMSTWDANAKSSMNLFWCMAMASRVERWISESPLGAILIGVKIRGHGQCEYWFSWEMSSVCVRTSPAEATRTDL